MKQSYVKTAEEAIKKAEAVQYRFLTQEEFGSGQVPDSVWEAGALEEQLDSLHRIARIDQEKAAGKLKERLCGVKRAKGPPPPDTPARSGGCGGNSGWNVPVSVGWEPGGVFS